MKNEIDMVQNGLPIFRADGKVLKSKLFSEPELKTILAKYPLDGNGKEPIRE